jgi:hypothetical protein
VIPAAERAIEMGSPEALLEMLGDTLHDEIKWRVDRVMESDLLTGGDDVSMQVGRSARAPPRISAWGGGLAGRVRRGPATGSPIVSFDVRIGQFHELLNS